MSRINNMLILENNKEKSLAGLLFNYIKINFKGFIFPKLKSNNFLKLLTK